MSCSENRGPENEIFWRNFFLGPPEPSGRDLFNGVRLECHEGHPRNTTKIVVLHDAVCEQFIVLHNI
eukprot:SAG11_NODE_36723_length_260_cov_0.645963_1_plen_66_part_10